MVEIQVQPSLVWSWANCSDAQLLAVSVARRRQRLPALESAPLVFVAGADLTTPLCCRNPHGLGVVFLLGVLTSTHPKLQALSPALRGRLGGAGSPDGLKGTGRRGPPRCLSGPARTGPA